METTLSNLVAVALRGEQSRGGGGAVLYNAETRAASYLFPSEFKVEAFREKLQEMIDDDGGEHFFVVVESDKQLHVSKMRKASLVR